MIVNLLNTARFLGGHPLNRRKPFAALGRYLRWQVGSRLVPGSVVFPWVNDTKLLAGLGEKGVTGNIYCGLHEFQDMAYVLHVLRKEDLFVDVGANSGTYTVLACGAVGARGISIEPVLQSYERLLLNIKINNIEKKVLAENFGVSDKNGFLNFSIDQDTMNHVVLKEEPGKTKMVRVRTLDDILRHETPTLMKVDTEGFELPAMRGAIESLAQAGLHSVIMELNGSSRQYGFDEMDVIELMANQGFAPYEYDPWHRSLKKLAEPQHEGNTLFVRDRERVKNLVEAAPHFSIFDFSI